MSSGARRSWDAGLESGLPPEAIPLPCVGFSHCAEGRARDAANQAWIRAAFAVLVTVEPGSPQVFLTAPLIVPGNALPVLPRPKAAAAK